MTDPDALLASYDDQLRTDAETPGAVGVTRLGPLRLVTFAGGRGFVTYRDLDGAGGAEIARLVREAREYFEGDPFFRHAEWKTRAHDAAPGLDEALRAEGFVADDPESIMIGEARLLSVDVPLPDGVRLRRVTAEADVRAMDRMQAGIFGGSSYEEATLARLTKNDAMQLWVAEADGRIISAGRLEAVPDSTFAGIWGGATRPEWRGKGIYRALTAARARAALARGKTLIHSDSTEFSRPILERSGLVKVSTTTPYIWRRAKEPART